MTILGSSMNEYRLLQLIGSGAYGLVYLAQNTQTNQPVAIKCIGKRIDKRIKDIKHSDQLTNNLEEYLDLCNGHASLHPLNLNKIRDIPTENIPCPFLREVSLQLQVHDHPGILKIHTILDSPVAIFIVMDYYSEGDLFVNIVDRHVYTSSSTLIKSVFTQLIDAVSYCHSRGIAHCDIKPENVMCADRGSRIALADFGLAVQSHFIQAKTCIGSSYYMPPERLATLNHDLHSSQYPAAKGDIWSLAVILINLCCTRNPWTKACEQDPTYRAYKRNPHVLTEILDISEELFEILHDCLIEEPSERITLFELRDRVLKCRGFTKTGALSHCDDMDEYTCGLIMECAVPDSPSVGSDSESLELPLLDFLDHGNFGASFDEVKKYEPTVSMMTNASFNLNVA